MKLQNFSIRVVWIMVLASSGFGLVGYGQCTAPDVNLGPDTSVCAGNTVVLSNQNGFTYSTYLWDNGSQGQSRTIYQSGTYWLEGRTLGNNVVTNGDFEQGNVGFTTSYTVGTGGSWGQLSNEGTYAINTSPSNVHNNFTSCNDHTPTPGTQMMIVNGSNSPNTTVWSQSVAIAPYTNYQFSVWAASAVSSPNLAQLQFSINNTTVGSTFSPSATPGVWGNFFQIWNSGANTTATISIVNQATATSGNDFMIDDISLAPMCKTRDTIVVNIFPNPVVNLGLDQTICIGSSTTLDAGTNIDAYQWSTGDNTQTITIQNADTFWVTATNGNLCSTTDSIVIQTQNQIDAGPDSTIVVCSTQPNLDLAQALSPGVNAGGMWHDLDNTTNGNLNQNGMLNTSGLLGTQNCFYILTDPYCPEDTALYAVQINPQPQAGPDAYIHLCNSDQNTNLNNLLNPLSNHSFYWDGDAALPASSFDEATGEFNAMGLSMGHYSFAYVQAADSMCVNDTALVLARITEVPEIDFSSQIVDGCAPIFVQFTNESSAAGNLDYKWSFGQGDSAFVSTPPLIEYNSPGVYAVSLQITSDSLCSSDSVKTDYIEVYPNPIADFTSSSYEIMESSPLVNFNNHSSLADFYQWSFGDGETSTDFEPQHDFPVEGYNGFVVRLFVSTINGCVDSTFQVYEIERSTLVFIPNAFTPDGDQHNNTFIPAFSSTKGISEYSLQIFDRWGKLIFESKDPNVGWDGNNFTQKKLNGTYNYKLQFYLAKDAQTHTYTGHVTLLH